MNRLVFLGGAGFIGYHLSEFFSRSNKYEVLVVDNLIRGESDKFFEVLCQRKNVTYLNFDLCDSDRLENALQQDDIVFNLAALNGTQNFYNEPMSVLRNTAITSIVVAESCAKAMVRKYVYFGSSESYAGAIQLGLSTIPTPEEVPFVFPDPTNLRWSYGLSKSIGEIACHAIHQERGIEFLILRIHNIYGPRMGLEHVIPDLIVKFLNGDMGVYGQGETRSFMYIDDLISIVEQIYAHPEYRNRVVNVGNGTETKILDLAELIRAKLKIDAPIQPLQSISGSVLRRVPDLQFMKSFTNLIPTSLNEGLDLTISYYLENLPTRMPKNLNQRI
jgi:UDP-glucose 4-epimerase